MSSRYLQYSRPRGVQIAWQLTPTQQATAERWLKYAYFCARRCARKWGKDMDDCLSAAHHALCKTVHNHTDGPWLQRNIRLSVAYAISQLDRVGSDRRPRPDAKHRPLYEQDRTTQFDIDAIDGRLTWETAKRVLPAQHYLILHQHLARDQSLRSIGRDMGLSPGWISQLYNQIVAQLRLAVETTQVLGCTGLGSAQRPDNAN